jgi:3-methyladenine DNA glycosylase AlkC
MKIKDYYNGDCAKLLADKTEVIFPDFKGMQFRDYVERNVSDKELTKRFTGEYAIRPLPEHKTKETIKQWRHGATTKETIWIINHGLRSTRRNEKTK